ncbi:protein distal antenna-related [Drosophila bipectinata]|uniref:protein distal antenna-related n=1 Tax=Drosophila bipectinata TaxID=42026 RepID=UPI001C89DBD7|nr:protein distal antenna-related [Drosophila bipectinata]
MDISAYQHMNIRMSTRGKRPLRNLTPNDKVRAIQRIHNGETKASVSRDIGVPESTLRGWCKNEQKLRFMCRQLGPDHHLGLDTPPEKRAKFELQLQLPPKFVALPPNYEELGFGGLPYSPTDYPVPGDSLLEKLSLVEFVKKNGVQPNGVGVMDYSNNMLHQLNLLALLNSKLTPPPPPTVDGLSVDATKIPEEDNKLVDSPPPATIPEDFGKNSSYPLLSVKNWAKDPAKQSGPEQVNDKNNNALESNSADLIKTPVFPDTTTVPLLPAPFPNPPADLAPVIAPPASAVPNGSSPPAEMGGDQQGAALLDWCKLFNASLNFLAFAAAAASMQPGGGNGPSFNPNQTGANPPNPTEHETETYPFHEGLLKRLSPLAHSEASNESYCDSEPEDLSVRSCASKASSSRSHSPAKSSGSSDAEQ